MGLISGSMECKHEKRPVANKFGEGSVWECDDCKQRATVVYVNTTDNDGPCARPYKYWEDVIARHWSETGVTNFADGLEIG